MHKLHNSMNESNEKQINCQYTFVLHRFTSVPYRCGSLLTESTYYIVKHLTYEYS